jgi:putative SOS response-associated peptidase YedK
MCYTVSINNTEKALEKLKKFKKSPVVSPNMIAVSGFTFPKLVVLKVNEAGFYENSLAHWGLVPSWVNNPEKAKSIREHTLNAKIETIHEKPSFKHLIQTNRCILPVSGFFEWREVNRKKYPYYIYPAQGELFYLACLQDYWVNSLNQKSYTSFTIITTEANEKMAFIHNIKRRMPLILQADEIDSFMNVHSNINNFKKNIPNEIIQSHTIKPLKNKTLNYSDLTPFVYPELNGLFGDI